MSRWDSLRPSSDGDGQQEQEQQCPRSYNNGQQRRYAHKNNRYTNDRRRADHRQRQENPRDSSLGRRRKVVPQQQKFCQDDTDQLVQKIRSQLELIDNNDNNNKQRLVLENIAKLDNLELSSGEVCILLLELLQRYKANAVFVNQVSLTLEKRLRDANDKKIKLILTKHQVVRISSSLSSFHAENDDVNPLLTSSVAHFVKNQVEELPAEETAQGIVCQIFLPCLEQNWPTFESNGKEHDDASTFLDICMAINVLLDNQRHSSALLAPLVRDVSMVDGKEEQVENPIRARLLSVLALHLNHKEGTMNIKLCVCDTLTVAVKSLRRMNGNTNTSNDGKRLVKSIRSFLLTTLNDWSTDSGETALLKISSLKFVRALVACYPDAASELGWKLIVDTDGRDTLSSLLSQPIKPNIVGGSDHAKTSETRHELVTLATELLSDFILLLPWKKWLDQNGTVKVSAKSGLFRRVVSPLQSLLESIREYFELRYIDSAQSALIRLLKTAIIVVPYCDEKLVHSGTKLWGALATTIFDSSISVSKGKQQASREVLIASAGGYVTPAGDLQGMCTPGRIWLLNGSSASSVFVRNLLETAPFNPDHSKMLSAILRTLPDVIACQWSFFEAVLGNMSLKSHGRENVSSLGILQSFTTGRKDFGTSCVDDEHILRLVCLVLENTKSNDGPQFLRCSLDIYSTFLDQDWCRLDSDEKLLHHFHRMLDICGGGNVKVREAACKALGEFCTQYFQSSALESKGTALKDRERLISSKVSSAMLRLAKESNSSVRAMSMFALGNLAYASRESKFNDLIELSRVRDICLTAFLGLEDSNDKVVGNSIRCCGHAGNLLARFLATEDPTGTSLSSSFDLLQQMIDSLAKKGSVALAVAMNGGEKTTLTWKQRSAAKKHGWGACYSLGLVFEEISLAVVNEIMISSICTAIQHLLLCQQHYESLHEKVFIAAESAICAIPYGLLVQIGVRTGCVGKALSNAIVILHQSMNVHSGQASSIKKIVSDKSMQQNQTVIIHLLPIASITDAYTVLLDDRITHETLEAFYTWMVEQPDNIMDAHAFEIFALALQRFGGQWSDNVSLEQRFASRALQKCKLSLPEELLLSDSNEDEEDEI